MESYKFSFFPTHFKLTQTPTKSPDGPPSYIIEQYGISAFTGKKINIIAFLDHFLESFKFLVFHEATFWIRGFGKIPYFSKNHKEKCHTYVRRYAFISGLYNGFILFFTCKRTSLSIGDLSGTDGGLDFVYSTPSNRYKSNQIHEINNKKKIILN